MVVHYHDGEELDLNLPNLYRCSDGVPQGLLEIAATHDHTRFGLPGAYPSPEPLGSRNHQVCVKAQPSCCFLTGRNAGPIAYRYTTISAVSSQGLAQSKH